MRYILSAAVTLSLLLMVSCGSDINEGPPDTGICSPEQLNHPPEQCEMQSQHPELPRSHHIRNREDLAYYCDKHCNVIDSMSVLGVKNTPDLAPFSRVQRIGSMTVEDNPDLRTLDGLHNLESVAFLRIRSNPELQTLEALSNLSEVIREQRTESNQRKPGAIVIHDNDRLEALKGLQGVTTLEDLTITDNDQITNLDGLQSVKRVNYRLTIQKNDRLSCEEINDFVDQLDEQPERVWIKENASTECDRLVEK
jgi:hypothetical protein